ncbi:hypothetical protein RV17_GL002021 [Enterococcus thailandicus]|nr:hypothetical protein RV17_GL002021 [Enterococcus thailandicus]
MGKIRKKMGVQGIFIQFFTHYSENSFSFYKIFSKMFY